MKTPFSTTFFLSAVTLVCAVIQSSGQGTLQIAFQAFPSPAPGTGVYVQQYFEAGIWFRPLGIVGPGNGFGRQRGGSNVPFISDNGTAYIAGALGDSLVFSFTNGSTFGLVSVDLAEYSTVVPNAVTVPFLGSRSDGSTVSVNFTTDGIIDGNGPLVDFETFYFGNEWTDLMRVEIPTFGWSLDNLVVTQIPEPASSALLATGSLLFCALLRRRQ